MYVEHNPKINVFESRRFSKALSKLSENVLIIVEDNIEKIIANPLIGEQKKGDLAHIRVHKFSVNKQQVLLGYSYAAQKLEIYLLSFSSHENFYNDLKKQRSVDLKLLS